MGLEHPFLGTDATPLKGITGKIPIKAQQTETPEDKNPKTPWSKWYSWVTAGGTTYIENTPGKIYYVTHIFLSIVGGGNVYDIAILDKNNGSTYLNYINIGDTEKIDVDYLVPLKFEDMVRILDTGPGGDVAVVMMVGYVQNKA